jgi:uncharacterized protein YjlB
MKRKSETITKQIDRNENFPNSKLPLLIYKSVADQSNPNLDNYFEKVIHAKRWGSSWRNGIYDYHHYHSTAHEVLAIYKGNAKVQLGGPEGDIFYLEKGDLIIIPSGIAHKRVGSSDDFACFGAYPRGQSYDMNYGKKEELEAAIHNIHNTPLPETDPFFGKGGPLMQAWE